jgi:hypothetical protein
MLRRVWSVLLFVYWWIKVREFISLTYWCLFCLTSQLLSVSPPRLCANPNVRLFLNSTCSFHDWARTDSAYVHVGREGIATTRRSFHPIVLGVSESVIDSETSSTVIVSCLSQVTRPSHSWNASLNCATTITFPWLPSYWFLWHNQSVPCT